MAKTKIQWTATWHPEKQTFIPGYTFNPWWGCTEYSPGCVHCYAMHQSANMSRRFSQYADVSVWGKNAPRRIQSDDYWKKVDGWNNYAKNLGIRLKVFCASMADIFEDYQPRISDIELPDNYVWDIRSERDRLWEVIKKNRNLDFLLLTKRPGNFIWRPFGAYWPNNVWLMVSAENQKEFNKRVPLLGAENALVKGISFEPLIAPIDTKSHITAPMGRPTENWWFVVGGESGQGIGNIARVMHPDWVRSLRNDAADALIPFHFKQWGEYGYLPEGEFTTGDVIKFNEAVKRKGVGIKYFSLENRTIMKKMGKSKSGQVLDGKEYDEYPGRFMPLVPRGIKRYCG